MAIAMAGFTVNDALTKSISAGLNVGQIMLVRGLFATAIVGAIAVGSSALSGPGARMHPMVALRVAAEAAATVCVLVALANLPIANVSSILQALPLVVTLFAFLFFGEKVGTRRWLAIGAGLAGVLLIVRPGLEGFNLFTLAALGCVACSAVRDLATRRAPSDIPSIYMTLLTATTVCVLGALLVVPFGGWRPMSSGNVAVLALAAVLLVLGYQFVIMAMRTGEIAVVAPFRYTALPWAILLGIVMFADMPDAATLAGAAIIICSGLYTLYRERASGRTDTRGLADRPDYGRKDN